MSKWIPSVEHPENITGENPPEPSAWREVREGYRTKTIVSGNCTIVLHRPILTEKERAKRERIVETALSNYGKAKQYIERMEA